MQHQRKDKNTSYLYNIDALYDRAHFGDFRPYLFEYLLHNGANLHEHYNSLRAYFGIDDKKELLDDMQK